MKGKVLPCSKRFAIRARCALRHRSYILRIFLIDMRGAEKVGNTERHWNLKSYSTFYSSNLELWDGGSILLGPPIADILFVRCVQECNVHHSAFNVKPL